MTSQTTADFWKRYKAQPKSVRKAAREAFRQFVADPSHPGLHFHRLVCDSRLWSVRITRSYRAVGLLQEDTITWVLDWRSRGL